MPDHGGQPTCFMAMPITTQSQDLDRYNGDTDHWSHVMESLFEKAIVTAGFRPIRPVAQGSHLIHGLIIRHLSTADMVLVDLSSHNPNVFFELGVRTSLNLPVALVRDEHTDIPFDTSGINTHTYSSHLRGWEIEREQEHLAKHIVDSRESCDGQNPLWRQFGLTIKASEPDADESPLEAKVDLLTQQLVKMQDRMDHDRILLVEEAMRASMPGAWIEPDLQTRTRTPPSVLFGAALDRWAGDRLWHRVHQASITQAIVEVDSRATSRDLERIEELAQRYEVDVDVRRVVDPLGSRGDDAADRRNRKEGRSSQDREQRRGVAPPAS